MARKKTTPQATTQTPEATPQAAPEAPQAAPKARLWKRKEGYGRLIVQLPGGRQEAVAQEPVALSEEALAVIERAGLLDTLEPVE